jgi:hypothetical protein
MLRRPPPLVLLVLGIALVLAAFALDNVTGTEGGAAVELAPATSTPSAAQPASSASPSPSATTAAPPTATVLPDRASCAAVEGTAYRSEAERVWYLANCTS